MIGDVATTCNRADYCIPQFFFQENLKETKDDNNLIELLGGKSEKGRDLKSMLQIISQIDKHNKELEKALFEKEMEMERILQARSSLEIKSKHQEKVRMFQLELLALRNVDLEKQLSKAKSSPS